MEGNQRRSISSNATTKGARHTAVEMTNLLNERLGNHRMGTRRGRVCTVAFGASAGAGSGGGVGGGSVGALNICERLSA
jgi:hypothetical protein